jgi:hypothetical protein
MTTIAEINSSEFPIIKVVFTGEAAAQENFPVYLQKL